MGSSTGRQNASETSAGWLLPVGVLYAMARWPTARMGLQALLPWLVMIVLVWRALGRAAKKADPFAGGIRLAFLAIFVAGMYHHVFLGFPVAWVLWSAIGLALHKPETTAAEEDRTRGNIVAIDAATADPRR